MSDLDTKTLSIVSEELGQFRAEMETINKVATRIAAKTNRIIKWVMILLSIISIFLVYLVYSMSNYLAVMLGHLDDMYVEFGVMSENMQVITRSVESIGGNISGMPIIAENMNVMTTDLQRMTGSVQGIRLEMTGMETNTGNIGLDTQEMAQRFDNLGRAINHIGYNVNQMGKPLP